MGNSLLAENHNLPVGIQPLAWRPNLGTLSLELQINILQILPAHIQVRMIFLQSKPENHGFLRDLTINLQTLLSEDSDFILLFV